MQEKLDLNKVQLNWSLDILKRINDILISNKENSDVEKLQMIQWLVKQALKIEREE